MLNSFFNFSLEKKLRQYERIIEENSKIAGEGFSRGVSLIVECKNVGLILKDAEIPSEIKLIKELLVNAQSVLPKFDYDVNLSEQTSFLFDKSSQIKNRMKEINEEISSIHYRIHEFDSYNEEKTYQQLRLKSVGLFNENVEASCCPLCNATITKHIPKVEEIKNAFSKISKSLENTMVSFPKLEAHVNKLKDEKIELQNQLKEIKDAIIALQQQEEKFNEIKGMENKYLMTIGRISLWIESFDLLEEKDEIYDEIEDLRKKLEKLNSLLNDKKEMEKFASIVNSIRAPLKTYFVNSF